MIITSQYDVRSAKHFLGASMVFLSQRDAGEMAAVMLIFMITRQAKRAVGLSNTDGGNQTAKRSSEGQETKLQAQRKTSLQVGPGSH